MSEIIIRRPRMVLALTEEEVLKLLKQDADLWAKALKRGKGLKRYEGAMFRKS